MMRCSLLCFLCMLGASLVVAAEEKDPPPSTLNVTRECAQGSTIYSEVPLHTGVANERAVAIQPIGTLKIPTGYEGGQYADCLQREGVTRDVAKDPYFARREECRQKVRGQVTVTPAGTGAPAIGSNEESRAIDACMRGEEIAQPAAKADAEHRIEVEVDKP
jgi:hypothetical protein